jgi:dipeptidyl aminopeptidase/acylaminoacyl peptidase
MKPFILPHSHRVSLRPFISIASCLVACLVVWILLVLRGCMNEHYRPHGHGNISFGISSRGNTLVFNAVGLGERDLYLLDLETHRVTRIAPTPDYEVDPEFSPDGKSVVYAAGKPGDRADHIFLRSLDGQMVKQLTADDANDASPAFSPDGSLPPKPRGGLPGGKRSTRQTARPSWKAGRPEADVIILNPDPEPPRPSRIAPWLAGRLALPGSCKGI